jgi:NADPH:quinone reductase-like Zn-dependent oxidoreductase
VAQHFEDEIAKRGHPVGLVIPIGGRFPLSNAREAHRLAERGGTGKVLLTV